MKTLFLITLIAVILLVSEGGLQAQTTQPQTTQVSIGISESIFSYVLNEQRSFSIYVPSSAYNQSYTKQQYPVIYLLDGALYFSATVSMVKLLSAGDACPEMIVIGIQNTNRWRDLTPTHMDSWRAVGRVYGNLESTGGGEKFMSFIEQELMPHIDSVYPTAPYRIFLGHSLGGLTVMNTLIHHPDIFNAYIAIDPSMSWDNQRLLKEARKVLSTTDYSNISLYLGIANTMKEGMDTLKVRKDTTNSTEHIRSILSLKDFLSINTQNGMNFGYNYYINDNHVSVGLITEYDALRFIFNYFNFNSTDYSNYKKNIENIYENYSKQVGYKVRPPESLVNRLAYQLLTMKLYDSAFELFKLNVSNYPKSNIVYDSMGDFYVAIEDKVNAIDNYTKALTIKEVPETSKKLESLQRK